LDHWIAPYEAGEKPSGFGLKKQFNAIQKHLFPWVSLVSKSVVEGAFQDLGTAFSQFFEGVKEGRKVGYPRFKS
jgi:putative transposase